MRPAVWRLFNAILESRYASENRSKYLMVNTWGLEIPRSRGQETDKPQLDGIQAVCPLYLLVYQHLKCNLTLTEAVMTPTSPVSDHTLLVKYDNSFSSHSTNSFFVRVILKQFVFRIVRAYVLLLYIDD